MSTKLPRQAVPNIPASVSAAEAAGKTLPRSGAPATRRPEGRHPGSGPFLGVALDPRLEKIGRRGADAFELALGKTLLHETQPDRYPLPAAASSIERRIEQALSHLPKGKRRKLRDAFGPAVAASESERRRRFGDLAAVDPRSAVPVLDQVRRLPVPAGLEMTAADLERAGQGLRKRLPATRRLAPRGAVPRALIPRLRRLECFEDTPELGKDEISLTALLLDDLGNSQQVGPIDLGKFKSGDVLDLAAAPRELFSFDLTAGEFPKAFAVTYLLVEEDPLDFAKVMVLFGIASLALIVIATLIMALAPAAVVLAAVLGGLGAVTLSILVAIGYDFPVRLLPRSVVELNAPDELFLDENGEKSEVSIPETLLSSTAPRGKGSYALTVDFQLA